MTLRHMEIFIEVCRTGSMTAAAKQLFLSQPAVSLAISEIEQEYDVKLFERIGNRLRLTEPGERLLGYVERIDYLCDEMDLLMKSGEETGTLRVGTTHNLGGFFLPKKVIELQNMYPKLRITAKTDKLEVIVPLIRQNELDVAVVEGDLSDPNLVSEIIGEDPVMFICPTDHPFADRDDVELEEVVREPVILRTKGNAVRDYFDGLLASRGYKTEPIWECGSNFPLITAVHNGLGISVAPMLHVHEAYGNREFRMFSIRGLTNPSILVHAIYHRNKYLTASARDFIELWKQGTSGEYPRVHSSSVLPDRGDTNG